MRYFIQRLCKAVGDVALGVWTVQSPSYWNECARITRGIAVSGNWLQRPRLMVEYGDWTIELTELHIEGGEPFTQCQAEWLNPTHFTMDIRPRGFLHSLLEVLGHQQAIDTGDVRLDEKFSINTNLPHQAAALLSDPDWREQLISVGCPLSVRLRPQQSSFRLTRSGVGTGVSDLVVRSSQIVRDEQKSVAMVALLAASLERFEVVGLTPPSLNERPAYREWLAECRF